MSYDPGGLDAALAAAVGDDPVLIVDLRHAFLESAQRQIALLERARCDANWQIAAWRLKGLAASFGVVGLIPGSGGRSHGRIARRTSVGRKQCADQSPLARSEEHTAEIPSLMRTSYAFFCLKKKNDPCRTPSAN